MNRYAKPARVVLISGIALTGGALLCSAGIDVVNAHEIERREDRGEDRRHDHHSANTDHGGATHPDHDADSAPRDGRDGGDDGADHDLDDDDHGGDNADRDTRDNYDGSDEDRDDYEDRGGPD